MAARSYSSPSLYRRTARPPSRARMVAYFRLGSLPKMYPCRYKALWKSSAVLASSQAWSMASRIRAYRAGSFTLGCSTIDRPYSRHSFSISRPMRSTSSAGVSFMRSCTQRQPPSSTARVPSISSRRSVWCVMNCSMTSGDRYKFLNAMILSMVRCSASGEGCCQIEPSRAAPPNP